MSRVIVHIDRLILRGFRGQDRLAVTLGLRQQLAQSLAEPDMLRNLSVGSSVARPLIGHLRLASGTSPRALGGLAAKAIAKSMRR